MARAPRTHPEYETRSTPGAQRCFRGGAMALGALFDSEVRCERIRPSLAIPGKGWPHKLQHLSQKLILAVAMQEEGAA